MQHVYSILAVVHTIVLFTPMANNTGGPLTPSQAHIADDADAALGRLLCHCIKQKQKGMKKSNTTILNQDTAAIVKSHWNVNGPVFIAGQPNISTSKPPPVSTSNIPYASIPDPPMDDCLHDMNFRVYNEQSRKHTASVYYEYHCSWISLMSYAGPSLVTMARQP